MKKFIALLLALVMCLSLVACGGETVDPNAEVIEAFNAAATAYDTVANAVNEDIDAYPQEFIDIMTELGNLMIEHKEMLESGAEIPEENAQAMIAALNDVKSWAEEAYNTLDDLVLVNSMSTDDLIEVFNYVSDRFNAVSAEINANIDAYDDAAVQGMVDIANGLNDIGAALQAGYEPTQEEAMDLMEQLVAIDELMDTFFEG